MTDLYSLSAPWQQMNPGMGVNFPAFNPSMSVPGMGTSAPSTPAAPSNDAEEAQRKIVKQYLDAMHKMEKAKFDLQFPEPPKTPKMGKGEGNTAILGSLIEMLLKGPKDQTPLQFGPAFLQSWQAKAQEEAQRQALIQQQQFQRQMGGMDADIANLDRQSKFAMSEADRLAKERMDRVNFQQQLDLLARKNAYDVKLAETRGDIDMDKLERTLAVRMHQAIAPFLKSTDPNLRKLAAAQLKGIAEKMPEVMGADGLADYQAVANEVTPDQAKVAASAKSLSANADLILQKLKTAKLMDPLKIDEFKEKLKVLPEKLQADLAVLKARAVSYLRGPVGKDQAAQDSLDMQRAENSLRARLKEIMPKDFMGNPQIPRTGTPDREEYDAIQNQLTSIRDYRTEGMGKPKTKGAGVTLPPGVTKIK